MQVVKRRYTFINHLILWTGHALFLFINLITVKPGHNWGDDFAQYIIHAQNILAGQPYSANLNLDSWVVGAPGFPLMLAGLIKVFGMDFTVFKSVNALLWAGHAVTIFYIAKRYLIQPLAVGASLAVASSPFVFMFKQSVLTDIPFTFFAGAALLSYIWFREHQAKRRPMTYLFFALALILASAALYIRHAGAILFLVFIIAGFVNRDSWVNSLVPFVVFAFVKWTEEFWGVPVFGNVSELKVAPDSWVLQYMDGFAYNITAFGVYLFPHASAPFGEAGGTVIWEFIRFMAVPVTIGLCLWLIWRMRSGRLSVRALFFCLYFLAVTIWPISDGVRYLLPIAGLLIIVIMYLCQRVCGMSSVGQRAAIWVAVIAVMINGLSIVMNFGFDDDAITTPEAVQLVDWLKENTDQGDHFAAQHPRALGLLAGRRGIQNWFNPKYPEPFLGALKDFNIRYLIFAHHRMGPHFVTYIYPRGGYRPVWSNDAYVIYEVTAGF